MYAIGYSDELLEITDPLGITWFESIWFISSNYTETNKVVEYFEKMDRNSKIIKSILCILNEIDYILHPFQIKEIDESYLDYLNSIKIYNNIDQNDPDFPYNFVCIEGIINCMNGKTQQQKYHNDYFDIKELNKIRNDFLNAMII